MDIDSAIPCGLLINELLTNSIKYAFPDGREGNIIIKMLIKDGCYVLSVEDDGIGFPEEIDFRNPNTLGLQIVQTLTQQLDGKIELETNGVTRFKISFNVENS
jgi:two-component sensor histidine kinase